MKLVNWKLRFISLPVFTMVILFLVSCGGGDVQPTEEENSRTRGQSPGESSPTEIPPEMNTNGTEFEEGELPADFPEDFPVHEEARIGTTIEMPGDNHFKVFLSFTKPLEEVLAYYRQELQARGWRIDSEKATSRGTELRITNPKYEAKLDFITSEMGVVLDLTIDPLGQALEIPGVEDVYGESSGLGETGGDFPADFPVPQGSVQIPIPEKLKSEGYQLVFSYPEVPEMAYIQLITGFMGVGWDIGEYTIDPATNFILMPFSDPTSGFEGYVLLTDDPDVIGMELGGGSIIALHTGVP